MKLSKLILVSGLLVPGVAFAQSAPVVPPATFTLTVTAQEVELIGKALGSMPFNEVASFIQKLRQQIVEQQQVKKPEAAKGEAGSQ